MSKKNGLKGEYTLPNGLVVKNAVLKIKSYSGVKRQGSYVFYVYNEEENSSKLVTAVTNNLTLDYDSQKNFIVQCYEDLKSKIPDLEDVEI